MATSEMDESEDAPGEEDADFSEDMSPAEDMDGVTAHNASSSSSEHSSRSPKRKASFDDDEYIKANPELYGLRRSGRARPSRRVVDTTSDSDEEDQAPSRRQRKRQKTSSARSSKSSTKKRTTSAIVSRSQSEDEDDTYGGERGRTFAKKHRKRMQDAAASGRDTPTYSEVRFSTRGATKVTNYNEDDNPELDEEDTDSLTPNYHYSQLPEDNSPAIDIVLNYRLKEGVAAPTDVNAAIKNDYDFFIKWQNQAHYHATWESWADLKNRRGKRRVENFFRKIVLRDLENATDPNVPPEDVESWNLEREAVLENVERAMNVERVIGSRDGDDGTEYYTKWRMVAYEFCTWEKADLMSTLAQAEIDKYLDRTAKLPTSNARESRLATRSDYVPFRTQPDYIKGRPLREFQIHGVNFLCHHWCKGNNVVLADEMGLGKTVQTVAFMNWLRHDRGQNGPFLVVVPLSTMSAWAETFDHWTPDINYVVYTDNPASRQVIQDYELLVDGNPNKPKFNVLLTTYEMIKDHAFLSQIKWQFMAVDEAHRLKNREAQLYTRLMDLGVPSRLLITGTPMQNTLSELSSLMDFLMPGKIHVDENIDLASTDASQKISELTNAVAPYMIRRTKKKVESDLPPKTEKIIRVELSDLQLEYYKNILTRNYAALNAGAGAKKTSLLNVMMELKKISNHPFMFPNAEERVLDGSNSREDQLKALITTSGKMMLLDRLLTKLKKDGHRVLIFSQMVKMLDILSDYLHLRGYQFQRLDGTIPAGPRKMAMDHFNAPDSKDFCFLLSTRAGGLGINLMTADTVILFDSDWNPQADLQAMARAHRIGQKKPVSVYRLVSKDTVEEEVLERARNKLMLEYITIQRGITDKDAKELANRMARGGAAVAEPESSDDISRILKRRGQRMFEQTGNQQKLEQIDIDEVLENAEEHETDEPEGITTDGGEEFLRSFDYTDVKLDLEWDDIIPKDQLEKLKEEERKRKEAEYLESVIEQNQPRKRKAPADIGGERGRAAKKRAITKFTAAVDGDDEDSGPDDSDDDGGQDPKRPLSAKECRYLIRAVERYGALEDMQDVIIKEARLGGRDIEVIKSTLQDISDAAARTLKEHEDEMAEREKATNKPPTKKDKKQPCFDFRGVKKVNAATFLERPAQMRMLRDVVANTTDWKSFRIPEVEKAPKYSCDWGSREDGMLCVGMARHGHGAWIQIRDDEELGMSDRLFLEEHRVAKKEERNKAQGKETAKSPGAVHLVRRADYLIAVLQDKTSNGTNLAARKQLENHHRNKKKPSGQLAGRLEALSAERGSTTPRHRPSDAKSTAERLGHGLTNGHRKGSTNDHEKPKHRPSEESKAHHDRPGSSQANGHVAPTPKDDTEAKIQRILSPVSKHLILVSGATKRKVPEDVARLKIIKSGLLAIGQHILSQVHEGGHAKLEDNMWEYIVDYYWPRSKASEKSVSGQKLRDMYKKVAGKDAAAAAAAKDAPAKPTPVTNGITASEIKKDGGVTTATTAVKKENVPAPPRKLPDFKRDPSAPKRDRDASRSRSVSRVARSRSNSKASSSRSASRASPPDTRRPDDNPVTKQRSPSVAYSSEYKRRLSSDRRY
ncbi:P-loop containing nucleoside triphosphate hydrolase protein [Neohortaea acidophila]|uniref:P-loop containing nucleoside triphosphate hydrolase protein n=1 Tax=Neohortaea acidophila TaxID=245834 RepID=A0A6A6PW82_9PEZI|nr:P-loop containing nucleoside triphosphate hydrolase protein [Neohortaea acidophila]KAF2484302.1 P-loop containing nucleoside triphosphate hydrolase protein [Neohortaea acidophila]